MDVDSIVRQTRLDRKLVDRVIYLIDSNEYKRRQAPLGVRVTSSSVGRGRRYPVSNSWNIKGAETIKPH